MYRRIPTSDEQAYLYTRAQEWAESQALATGRTQILKLTAAAVPALVGAALLPASATAAPRRRPAPSVAAAAGSPIVKRGRSWSGAGAIARVEVSTDSGRSWRPAKLSGPNAPQAWTRWSVPWQPGTTGPTQLLARATDTAGRTQPDAVPFDTGGYLFGALVRHLATVDAG